MPIEKCYTMNRIVNDIECVIKIDPKDDCFSNFSYHRLVTMGTHTHVHRWLSFVLKVECEQLFHVEKIWRYYINTKQQ